ncbi:MAG TPA: phospholipase D-like domain-containing protein [Acidobacteriota bacterium]
MASQAEPEQDAFGQSRQERTILEPDKRRETLLSFIRGARHRLLLSVFRCDDFKVLDALPEALRRGVRVEVLLTSRAKGGKKRLKELWEYLESLGAQVHRYSDPVVKYHAKYVVADDGPALVASLNFTRKCFERTCDFIHITHDRQVVSGLKRLFEADCRPSHSSLPEGLSNRLIVGPELARGQLTALLQQARRSIRIIDHKLTDPTMITLLEARRAEGVAVEILGGRNMGSLLSHGKMILIDQAAATIGSISLSALSLGFRRELALLVQDPVCVSQLNAFFQQLREGEPGSESGQESSEDEDEEE